MEETKDLAARLAAAEARINELLTAVSAKHALAVEAEARAAKAEEENASLKEVVLANQNAALDLSTKMEKVERDADYWRTSSDDYRRLLAVEESRHLSAKTEIAALRAENARLRAALLEEVTWLQAALPSPIERLNRIFALRTALAKGDARE